eukprot:TRINITY_DN6134_c0_g2_i1.p1 TRINITY_DN6134_c0_g2~~TRINITY_DN6134_c0_g2_i1.p1  ORF type:complete len:558 (-),score=44.09 TRINITY_DN6134_c0_g2_i1:369-2042(-)
MPIPAFSQCLDVSELPLGPRAFGVAGPRGPSISVLDVCAQAGVVFVANGESVFAFTLSDLQRNARTSSTLPHASEVSDFWRFLGSFRESAEGAGQTHGSSSVPLRPCWSHCFSAQVNNIRCDKRPRSEAHPGCWESRGCDERCILLCVVVCDDGVVSSIVSSRLPFSAGSLSVVKWYNGSSTWGLALRPDPAAAAAASAGTIAEAVIGSNDRCVKALRLSSTHAAHTCHLSQTHCMAGHRGNLPCVDVSPDGLEAVSASLDRSLRCWDLKSGRELNSVFTEASWSVLYLPLAALQPPLLALKLLTFLQPEPRAVPGPGILFSVCYTCFCVFSSFVRCSGQVLRQLGFCLRGRRSRSLKSKLNASSRHLSDLPLPLPEHVLLCVIPYVNATTLLHVIAVGSRNLRSAVEAELRSALRHEWLMLHVCRSNIILRMGRTLQELDRLPMPFSGEFSHLSYSPCESLAFVSSSMNSRPELWVLRVERKPLTLSCNLRQLQMLPLGPAGVTVLGHTVFPCLIPRHSHSLTESQRASHVLLVLLSDRRLLGFEISRGSSQSSLV